MKTTYLLLVFVVLFSACKNDLPIEETTHMNLALEDFDYFEEDIPFFKTNYSSPANHDDIAALGRILFYDARLSQNNTMSCGTCHKQALGFADSEPFSFGVKNIPTTRNSMSLVNNAYQNFHFWEGKSGRIEDHVLNPISNHIEMGMRNIEELVEKLSEIDHYNDLFDQVYQQEVSEEGITTALSTFVGSIISYNSKFDAGSAINYTNFTLNELDGKDLFFGKAKCSDCHKGNHFTASWRDYANIGLDLNYEDKGAGSGQFKIPSLRNIELTSPYMHDGRFETLEEVVNHYTEGLQDHPLLDWTLRGDIDLTEREKVQLIEFLRTLTDYSLVSDERFSNPF